ncbi:MAG: major capsid protein [Candidatus Heimdallarchaeaceae archaeon]
MGIEFLDLTRRMGQSFVKTAPKPRMFLQFFGNSETQDTEIIEIDKQFKGIRIAGFVNPDAVADGTEKLSFDEHTFKLPTLQDLETLTSKELKKRLRGQNVYTQETFAAKAAVMVAEIQQEQREMVENAMELMSIDAAFNGQLTVVGKGENRIVDFDRNAANTIDLTSGLTLLLEAIGMKQVVHQHQIQIHLLN